MPFSPLFLVCEHSVGFEGYSVSTLLVCWASGQVMSPCVWCCGAQVVDAWFTPPLARSCTLLCQKWFADYHRACTPIMPRSLPRAVSFCSMPMALVWLHPLPMVASSWLARCCPSRLWYVRDKQSILLVLLEFPIPITCGRIPRVS